MAWVISNVAFDLDQLRDTSGRPQSVLEPKSLRPALQSAFNAMQIRLAQTRWTPDRLRFAKSTAPTLFKLLCPATDRLPMDANLACDFGLAQTLAQQIDGLHPPPLERIEISPYSSWVSHAHENNRMSLCYAMLNNRIGRIRSSSGLCSVLKPRRLASCPRAEGKA